MTSEFWVFVYGSLMGENWADKYGVSEKQKAVLSGYQRIFAKASTKNWGSTVAPAPTLALEEQEGSSCEGIALCFPIGQKAAVMALLEDREGRSASFIPKQIMLSDKSEVSAITAMFDPTAKSYMNRLSLGGCAEMARLARGIKGSGVDYVMQVHEALAANGITDPVVRDLWNKIASEA